MIKKETYGSAIRSAFEYLLDNYPEVFVIGQGLWSPWYVGETMTDLDKKYGIDRIIDTPVSESACTGMAVGASLCGSRPIVVHPRIDFMLYAMDAVVNQAAKWSHMTGAQASPGMTIRAIINRGGEQGAQHSQSLHSWFSHIPGLKVVMPFSVQDARDMLISSVLDPSPVIYIDDRWLYDQEAELGAVKERELTAFIPKIIREGKDVTIAATSYSSLISLEAASILERMKISSEVIDIRTLNPFDPAEIINSVKKTRNLIVVDGSWKNSGFAAEVISSVAEVLSHEDLSFKAKRIHLPDSPAPTASSLEEKFYPSFDLIVKETKSLLE
tara:strand:+ start:150 stop:1133 length:984 start_codon:yes stop_codon:yes gene_type:complete